jgi:Ca2+-binding RTX toxin-like protein
MVPRRRTRAARAATAVVGGDGNDEIYAFNAMSAPGGTAFGGDGDDMIWLGNGRENGGGHVVYGEAGDDVIYRSGMGDALYGDFDPNDPREWVLPAGNDRIYGNSGDDLIYGGGGEDELSGGDGDDYLEGGAGFDLLVGGAGDDTAMTDGFDKISEIEHLMVVL